MSLAPGVKRICRLGVSALTTKHRLGLVGVIVVLVIATRLLSLSFTPLPFNNDGITESRIADDIVSSGGLEFPDNASYLGTHSTITPVYNVLLAFCASSIGVSAFSVAQFVTAAASLVTILATYVLSFEITKSRISALASSMTLSLLGSFVYLTASTWKAAFGVSLFILLAYAYCNRSDKRYLVLEVLALCLLPFIHHLVAVLAYLFVAYMTVWSVVAALRHGRLRARHFVDIAVVIIPTIGAYSYYHLTSLDKLDYLSDGLDYVVFGSVFVLVAIVLYMVLMNRRHLNFTLAWIPVSLVFGVFLLDFIDPLFSYSPGTPKFVLVLATVSCAVVGLGWYGFEVIIESKSRYRAVPLGLFLPVLTLALFALSFGFGLRSHQILYRSYDFIFISVALGVGVALMPQASRPRMRYALTALLVVALVISFPFGHATGTLTGVRHDTQEYEVDALRWVAENVGINCTLQSDERLSYNAKAIFDIAKRNDLPYMLNLSRFLPSGSYGLYESEWTVVGVNDYPRGHPVLDPVHVGAVMARSDVLYVGGPLTNQVVVLSA